MTSGDFGIVSVEVLKSVVQQSEQKRRPPGTESCTYDSLDPVHQMLWGQMALESRVEPGAQNVEYQSGQKWFVMPLQHPSAAGYPEPFVVLFEN